MKKNRFSLLTDSGRRLKVACALCLLIFTVKNIIFVLCKSTLPKSFPPKKIVVIHKASLSYNKVHFSWTLYCRSGLNLVDIKDRFLQHEIQLKLHLANAAKEQVCPGFIFYLNWTFNFIARCLSVPYLYVLKPLYLRDQGFLWLTSLQKP